MVLESRISSSCSRSDDGFYGCQWSCLSMKILPGWPNLGLIRCYPRPSSSSSIISSNSSFFLLTPHIDLGCSFSSRSLLRRSDRYLIRIDDLIDISPSIPLLLLLYPGRILFLTLLTIDFFTTLRYQVLVRSPGVGVDPMTSSCPILHEPIKKEKKKPNPKLRTLVKLLMQ